MPREQNSGFGSNSSGRIGLLFGNFFCDHCGKRYRRQKRDLGGGMPFGPQGWVHENVIGQILYYIFIFVRSTRSDPGEIFQQNIDIRTGCWVPLNSKTQERVRTIKIFSKGDSGFP